LPADAITLDTVAGPEFQKISTVTEREKELGLHESDETKKNGGENIHWEYSRRRRLQIAQASR
jgi:hypothetical protein